MPRHSEHPGANHFYIHVTEMSPSPERAIPSGEWELAATLNERAANVDRQYMKLTGVASSSYAGYYIHNLHFVYYARAHAGPPC